MTLRKHGAETFPDDIETTLEIAMMGEGLSDRVADSVEWIMTIDGITA